MEPEQDDDCRNTYGDNPDESGWILCYGCEKPVVITILGAVWTDSMDSFMCDECWMCN